MYVFWFSYSWGFTVDTARYLTRGADIAPLLHQQVGYITIHHIEEQLQFLNYTPTPNRS